MMFCPGDLVRVKWVPHCELDRASSFHAIKRSHLNDLLRNNLLTVVKYKIKSVVLVSLKVENIKVLMYLPPNCVQAVFTA